MPLPTTTSPTTSAEPIVGGPDNGGDDDWALMNITAILPPTINKRPNRIEVRETAMMTTTKMSFGSLTVKDNDQY